MSGNLAEFGIASAEGRYSIEGYGLSTSSGDGAAGFTWRPQSFWKQARIYYLKQPGGGSMRCGNALQTMRVAVDTTSPTFDLGFVDVAFYPAVGGDTFGCDQMTGKVAVYGALSTLGPGVMVANWSEGGRWLTAVASQDGPMRRRWFAELKPAAYFLNAGANGIGVVPDSQFEAELRLIAGDIRTASPATALFIVQFNDARGFGPASLDPSTELKRRVATDLGARFLDNRDVIGRFPEAFAAGYMADDIHLSDEGYRQVGEYYARTLGLTSTVADPGPTPYPQ